jgi:Phosphoglycerate dehydrogenase and related dehydrogenases
MKKAVFLNRGRASIDRVYNREIQEKLASELDFLPECYDIKKIEENPNDLLDVEYVFSTWGMLHLSEEQIKKYLPSVKAVFYGAGSVQEFAREFLACGVSIFSAWGANGVPVAEFTVAQIILASKGYFQRFHRYANDTWSNKSNGGDSYDGMFETNIGIIGAGMIGKMVIEMLKAYTVNVHVFDPFLPDSAAAEMGVNKVATIPELFGKCDVISNHLANNAQTVGMINADSFDKMKKNAVFINTGRGAQVVESDLIAALKAEPLRVALLDVTEPEPPRPDSEFYSLENVFLSPHIAGSIGHEVWRQADYMYEEYKSFDAGKATRFGVTMKMLETMA